jgi:hypothetical protein
MKRATPLFVVALVGAGIIVGTLVRPLAARMDATPPQIGWGPATMLFTIAVLIGGLAWNTWQSLHKKNRRMTSDHGVTMLALAKASSAVAALFAGAYGGYAIAYLGSFDSPLGEDRVIRAGAAAIAGLLMLIAALVLERSLRIPGGDDESDGGKAVPGATPA